MPIINSNNIYYRPKSLPYYSALTPGFSRNETVSDGSIGLGGVSEMDSLRDLGKFFNLSETQFSVFMRNDNHRILMHIWWNHLCLISVLPPNYKFPAGKATSVWFASVSPEPGTKMSHPRSWNSDICCQIACPHAHCLLTICYQTVSKPNCLPTHSIGCPSLDHLAEPTCLHASLGRKACQ